MAKTIVFKPEFEAKLKKLKIKTLFVSNIKRWIKINSSYVNFTLDEYIENINKSSNWQILMIRAFLWDTSPEGHKFWEEVSKV